MVSPDTTAAYTFGVGSEIVTAAASLPESRLIVAVTLVTVSDHDPNSKYAVSIVVAWAVIVGVGGSRSTKGEDPPISMIPVLVAVCPTESVAVTVT